jgi:hypothetical protein
MQYFHGLFKLPLTSFNTNAQTKLKELAENEKENYKFKCYEGEIVQPYQIWSTDIGGGARQMA